MRHYLVFLALTLLVACGEDHTAPVPVAVAPVTAQETRQLSPSALVCPTRSSAEETLDFLRRVLGDGELRKECTISDPADRPSVRVEQQEVQRLSERQGDRVIAWRSVDGSRKGWTPMPFLLSGSSDFYPLALTAASEQERVYAWHRLDDLLSRLSLEQGSPAYNELMARQRRDQAYSRESVHNRQLELLALSEGVNHLGTHILLCQWRYAGQEQSYWSRLVDLFATAAARSALADRLGTGTASSGGRP